MSLSAKTRRHITKGCYSEMGKLRKVVMCSPTYFRILRPINATQWLYHSDGLPQPKPLTMVQQHRQLVNILQEAGVEIDLLPPIQELPYQHATRDVGVVIGETLVLSNLKEEMRRLEVEVARPVLEKHGLRVLNPEQGFIEGGDVIVDNGRLWVGLGSRTDERGAEFLHHTFGRDYDVIPLHFDPRYTHLDTILGILGQGHVIVYEPAFHASSLQHIRNAYSSIISLTDDEQQSAGANVLCLSPDTVISIAENESVNTQLINCGYEVIPVSFSEVIKSGGSVRCDTLPIERV